MRAFLIDAENVNIEQFFSISGFEKDDKFYIIGNTTLKFSTKILQFLQEHKYKIYTFDTPRKDYADKMIFTILGAILNDDEIHEFLIISKSCSNSSAVRYFSSLSTLLSKYFSVFDNFSLM